MFSVSCGKSRAKAVCPSAVREGSCLCERLLFEANSAATLLEFKEKKKKKTKGSSGARDLGLLTVPCDAVHIHLEAG